MIIAVLRFMFYVQREIFLIISFFTTILCQFVIFNSAPNVQTNNVMIIMIANCAIGCDTILSGTFQMIGI